MTTALFFHGYGQNGLFFKDQRRMHKVASLFEDKGYQVFFLNGFQTCPSIQNGCNKPYTWMTNSQQLDDHIHKLLMNFNNNTLYLIGFSEGSVFIDVLLRYYNINKLRYNISIKGAIFCAGHINTSILTEIPSIPTLHIWGNKDDMVEPYLSKKLYKKYKKKHSLTFYYTHNKSHLFPLTTTVLSIIADFIQ